MTCTPYRRNHSFLQPVNPPDPYPAIRGSSAPTCRYCGEPNPEYRPADDYSEEYK